MDQIFLIALIFVGWLNGYRSKSYESEIFWIGFMGCAMIGLVGISLLKYNV